MWISFQHIPSNVVNLHLGKTFVIDFEAYTFVFSIKNTRFFSLKCDIYYAFTFNAIYLYVLKLNIRELILHLITSLKNE